MRVVRGPELGQSRVEDGSLLYPGPRTWSRRSPKGDFYPVALIALAAALSPNPDRPMLVDLPVRRLRNELLPAEPVYTRWHEQFPVQRVAEARESLSRLRLLVLDYGIDDQFTHIPAGTAAFSRELVRYRIPHRLDVYDGDHRAQLPDRLRAVVFPTLSKALAGGAKERGSGHPQ